MRIGPPGALDGSGFGFRPMPSSRPGSDSSLNGVSRKTLSRLLEAQGFRVLGSGPVRNTYSLHYLAHLLPLPGRAKATVMSALGPTRLGRLSLSVRLGNLYAVAERPRAEQA